MRICRPYRGPTVALVFGNEEWVMGGVWVVVKLESNGLPDTQIWGSIWCAVGNSGWYILDNHPDLSTHLVQKIRLGAH